MKLNVDLWVRNLTVFENLARLVYGCAGLVCLFYGLLPIVGFGITNSGVGAVLCGGILLSVFFLTLPALKKKFPRAYKPAHIIFFVLVLCAVALYVSFVLSYRGYCAKNPPPEGSVPQTVIVLGGAIDGDRPKLMLARRLDTAAEYLAHNPAAQCVVSGGQGRDEDYPEALVMFNYLLERDIAPERLWMEGKSTDTRENIAFSAEIMARESLSTSVTIVTDSFHQLRAAYFCKRGALVPHALSSLTPWGLLPTYEIREMGAWVKALLDL